MLATYRVVARLLTTLSFQSPRILQPSLLNGLHVRGFLRVLGCMAFLLASLGLCTAELLTARFFLLLSGTFPFHLTPLLLFAAHFTLFLLLLSFTGKLCFTLRVIRHRALEAAVRRGRM